MVTPEQCKICNPAEMQATLERVEEFIKRAEPLLTRLDEAVRGNGKPGIKQEIASLNGWKAMHAEEHRQIGNDWRALAFPIIAQIVSAGIGAGLALLAIRHP